jgi:hypothetical protein
VYVARVSVLAEQEAAVAVAVAVGLLDLIPCQLQLARDVIFIHTETVPCPLAAIVTVCTAANEPSRNCNTLYPRSVPVCTARTCRDAWLPYHLAESCLKNRTTGQDAAQLLWIRAGRALRTVGSLLLSDGADIHPGQAVADSYSKERVYIERYGQRIREGRGKGTVQPKTDGITYVAARNSR